ncbi:hypothetical protein IWW55_001247, partial [Coemansia sp. RSA 2706]
MTSDLEESSIKGRSYSLGKHSPNLESNSTEAASSIDSDLNDKVHIDQAKTGNLRPVDDEPEYSTRTAKI